MTRPLPPLPRRALARTFGRRFGDDRELAGFKISLLIGIGILTAMLDWAR